MSWGGGGELRELPDAKTGAPPGSWRGASSSDRQEDETRWQRSHQVCLWLTLLPHLYVFQSRIAILSYREREFAGKSSAVAFNPQRDGRGSCAQPKLGAHNGNQLPILTTVSPRTAEKAHTHGMPHQEAELSDTAAQPI